MTLFSTQKKVDLIAWYFACTCLHCIVFYFVLSCSFYLIYLFFNSFFFKKNFFQEFLIIFHIFYTFYVFTIFSTFYFFYWCFCAMQRAQVQRVQESAPCQTYVDVTSVHASLRDSRFLRPCSLVVALVKTTQFPGCLRCLGSGNPEWEHRSSLHSPRAS